MALYSDIYNKLNLELGIITFFKKNGQIRVMLGTRNLKTVALKYGYKARELGGHDKRCGIDNGNMAVFDMAIGEARSFNVERLCGDIKWLGEVYDEEYYDALFNKYIEYKEAYESFIHPVESLSDISTDGNTVRLTSEDVNNVFN